MSDRDKNSWFRRTTRVVASFIAGLISGLAVVPCLFVLGSALGGGFKLGGSLMLLVGFPIGPLIGISVVDKLTHRTVGFDWRAIGIGVLAGLFGIIPSMVFLFLAFNCPLIRTRVSVILALYPLVATIFPFLGFHASRFFARGPVAPATESGLSNEKSHRRGFEGRKVKQTSKLAIFSLLLALFPPTVLYLFLMFKINQHWKMVFLPFVALLSTGSLILAVLGSVCIASSKRVLGGYHYAVGAIIISMISLWFMWGSWSQVTISVPAGKTAVDNLQTLYNVICRYTEDNNGLLPTADRWCDLLMEYDEGLNAEHFSRHSKQKRHDLHRACHFAFNTNVSGLRLSDIPQDVVLLFEADGPWNLAGTSDLLDKRMSGYGVVHVLLVGGTVESYLHKRGEIVMRIKPFGTPKKTLRWVP
jgi:hypothetical protein